MRAPRIAALVALACALSGALVPAAAQARTSAPHASDSTISVDNQEGTYQALSPSRIYDTRRNLRRPLKPGESLKLRVTDKAGVPSAGKVEAVVINLTTTGPTRNGYLAAYPSNSAGTGISTLTFAKGDTRAVLATVPVGPDGSIVIRNGGGAAAGSAHAIVDVDGYYRTASADQVSQPSDYLFLDPFRSTDTREYSSPLQPYYSYEFPVYWDDDASDIDALVVNLTAVGAQAPGYLTAYADYDADPPATSSLNFVRGRTTTNQVVVPVVHRTDDEGDAYTGFAIFAGTERSVHVISDVVGVYAHGHAYGQRFVPLESPVRVADSRTGTGGIQTLGPRQSGQVDMSSVVDDDYSTTVLGSLTAVRPTASTFLTAWPSGDERPDVSNVNPFAGQTVANQAVVTLGPSNLVSIYNQAGRADVLFDAVGHFDIPPDAFDQQRAGTLAQQRAHPATRSTRLPEEPVRRAAHR